MTVLYAAFPVLAVWFVIGFVRRSRQSLSQGCDRALKDLSRHGQVPVWTAYPLSEPMIKELAASKGFRYTGDRRTYNGTRTLLFEAPRAKRKLSLDD
ncbi:hypothetical protein [Amycolatopsis pittospori]|uniref:hypothetical protein n=1 Tax=Amycolatopsis pittospori TaxID=2749434 RepID=UPI0015F03FBA|nr:hypothetical protein [Amycolatopsis pittospori]